MTKEQEGLRYRRTQSVTRAEEIKAFNIKVRYSQPDKPCHKPRDSLFSWSSKFNNFTGFINWAFLLLSIGSVRLLLENFIKYGIRIDPLQWIYVITGFNDGGSGHPAVALILYSFVPITTCLMVEKGLAVKIISNIAGMITHIINLVVLILLPMIVIHVKEGFNLVGASVVTSYYTVLFLKMWSYIQVNLWCRTAHQRKNSMRRSSISFTTLLKSSENTTDTSSEVLGKQEKEIVQYPDNLNFRDMFYFLCAPTLCYELNFPRTGRIRKRFLMKRIFEVVAGTQIILCLIQQYIIPSIINSLIPFSNMDITQTTERLLKLAIPNHLTWLIFFYITFHSYFNLIGELLQFGDRNFYSDWWNANNIDTFWRSWNLPVHRWALRHLYLPIVEMGFSKTMGFLSVFFISAFFHEYMVSVPLKTYKIWAFTGMMGQLPLSTFANYVEKRFGPRWGNIIVWSSLILGQPLCIMMYYHDYVVTHYGESLLEEYGRL
ncbi:hypothetical protein WA026_020269 [Henosepilachna vigintioctopunctata]|uniref:O-acyltransferase n=1 Tax=Henosepilachna vigintioctopunctata TaxID=420089 RepID=A0AAW1TX37_9CUCU